jgi:hypothetical protein
MKAPTTQKARTTQYTTPPSVVAQVARLPEMEMSAIRTLWKRLFGGDTPTYNRQFLERRIAYKLQLIEFKKVDSNLLKSNQRRIRTLIETGKLRKRSADFRPIAGTILTRLYQDKEYRILVGMDGQYEYEGRRYGSLSMIAREITGTRWSGPLFFGLRAPAKPKATIKRGGRE